jgi:hypothetical protein
MTRVFDAAMSAPTPELIEMTTELAAIIETEYVHYLDSLPLEG